MSKITHLSSVHTPFDIRIFRKECAALSMAGHEVSFIVADDGPDAKVDGLTILRVPKPKDRVERFSRTGWRVYRRAVEADSDIYHFHDAELLPFGLLLRLRGKKVIYDVHEDLPKQVLSKPWLPGALRSGISWIIDPFERMASRAMSGVVAATPAIARRFPRGRTAIVQNFPITEELVVADALPYQKRPPWLAYVGGITEIRGAREMAQAMNRLPDGLNACLKLAGECTPASLRDEMQACADSSRLAFLGFQSRKEVAGLLGSARLGFVLFHPVPNHLEAQPNKLFEYMSAGVPVIASDFPLWREIVDGIGCGLLVDPLDPAAIATAVQYLLENPYEAEKMGEKGRNAVARKYNWDAEKDNLLAFYNTILQ